MISAGHREQHRGDRAGWLRASVLGANDGIISVASLVVGVAAAGTDRSHVLVTGVAGLVAGAMSMAAGEYVSVQSQSDTENADIAKEKRELQTEPDRELVELTAIYVKRGLEEALARQVAEQFMRHDALEAHLRDELGIVEHLRARPVQAALASAASFAVGAIVPVLVAALVPRAWCAEAVSATTFVMLAVLGGAAAYTGGASVVKGTVRIVFWGAIAMGIAAMVGRLFGATV